MLGLTGPPLLVLALLLASFAGVAGAAGGVRADRRLVDAARKAMDGLASVLLVVFLLVEVAFRRSDF